MKQGELGLLLDFKIYSDIDNKINLSILDISDHIKEVVEFWIDDKVECKTTEIIDDDIHHIRRNVILKLGNSYEL